MKQPVRVMVTGAAGQIGYSLIYRIAAGEMLGPDQPVILHLLELPQAEQALRGVVMELEDCAFPLLHQVVPTTDLETACGDIDYALLVGARPRSKGMERQDLLMANAAIFSAQGMALSAHARPQVKVLVVGNPANTNALITQKYAKNINPRQIHAMMRLDHNRARAQVAAYLGCLVSDVQGLVVWGNHSVTQYPDLSHARAQGLPVTERIPAAWIQEVFVPTVQKRGAQIIEARGASSAASAAHAAICHVRDWVLGIEYSQEPWISMGVPSDGSYGIPEGVVFGFPCRTRDGDYEIVTDLPWSPIAQEKILASYQELQAEAAAVASLLNP